MRSRKTNLIPLEEKVELATTQGTKSSPRVRVYRWMNTKVIKVENYFAKRLFLLRRRVLAEYHFRSADSSISTFSHFAHHGRISNHCAPDRSDFVSARGNTASRQCLILCVARRAGKVSPKRANGFLCFGLSTSLLLLCNRRQTVPDVASLKNSPSSACLSPLQ